MSNHLSDTFRANVRAAMRAQHLTQSELARRMHTSTHLVNKILLNPRGIGLTLATVEGVSTALGIEPGTMVTPGGVQRSRVVTLERPDERKLA